MTVLVVGHSYLAAVNLARLEHMARLRPAWNLAVVVPEKWTHPTLGLEYSPPRSATVDLIPVPISGSSGSSSYRYQMMPLARSLRHMEVQHVHIEQEPFSAAALQLAMWSHLNSVPWSIFSWENLPRRYGAFRRSCARFVLRGASIAVGGSKEAATQLKRNGARAVDVAPQFGVNTGRFAPRDQQPSTRNSGYLHVGYVGRLVEEKGVDVAIRAMASPSLTHAHLTIVGGGPDEARLRRLAQSLAPTRVQFLPPVEHNSVPHILQELDVLVLPSRHTPTWAEQFGRILIEAMASGVVPIGAQTGAIPEVIGDTGLTFPDADVDGLVSALLTLSDRSALDALSDAARRRAHEIYSDDAIAQRWVAIFERLRHVENGPHSEF